ncbi:DUF3592 domain-containing protein [Corallococcus sp. AS-1-12]|uniref:DUF3592 domain-containing protein n=1 Tax=Corallococcus sp. AS-1-12 TaxID=2874598 RepID=UPI001CBCA575|nr:DUF3592 domain-containing protein [Corallococcus sp. AS-1-12]MBZ4334991.1 hypothetical protein [Corallococcus sp. AS-1-12]
MSKDAMIMAFVAASWALTLLGIGALVAYFARRVWKQSQVRQHGLPGEATVRRFTPTRMYINRRQIFEFVLEVRLPGQAPYPVSLSSTIQDWNVQVMDVGLRLKVKVDPKDPQRVVVLGPVVEQDLTGFLLQGMGAMTKGPPAQGDPVKALADLQRMADAGLVSEEEFARKRAEILGRL